jgi:RNA polymerase sigma-32 factor
LAKLGEAANARRNLAKGKDYEGKGKEVVTYMVDRNINYTNVCDVYCKFCAFYRTEKDADHYVLSQEQIDSMARTLNVKREEVIEMEQRMAGGDVLLDPSPGDDGEDAYGPIAYLADASHEPTALIESHQRDLLASDGIAAALEELDPRSRRIVQERWLKVNDDGSGGMTLHELAAEYQVSAERIRQIEVAAMKKMRKALAAYA